MCDGDLRTEEQVPGREFWETRAKEEAPGLLASGQRLSVPRVLTPSIWPAFYGASIWAEKMEPEGPNAEWRAGFVSGAALLPAGSISPPRHLASSDFQMWTLRSHSRGFYLQRSAGLFFRPQPRPASPDATIHYAVSSAGRLGQTSVRR